MTTEKRIPVKMVSGDTYHITPSETLGILRELHEWYGGQEKEWHGKTYEGQETFSEGNEREWMRYARESAALQLAIDAFQKVCS